MKKKKRYFLIILSMVVIFILLIYYRPQNIGDFLDNESPIRISYSGAYVDSTKEIEMDSKSFIINPTDEVYDRIIDLLSNYNYHNSIIATIMYGTTVHELTDSYIIRNTNTIDDIIIYSDGNCEFIGKHGKIGYFSKEKGKKLCAELKSLLQIER